MRRSRGATAWPACASIADVRWPLVLVLAVSLWGCTIRGPEKKHFPATLRLPSPSSRLPLDNKFFATSATLGDVADRLRNALWKSNIGDIAFYDTPGGFVLVTTLLPASSNQPAIYADQRCDKSRVEGPADMRWVGTCDLRGDGRYRLFAFEVTDGPSIVTPDQRPMSESEAGELQINGASHPSEKVKQRFFGPRYTISALVYEFDHAGGTSLAHRPESMSALAHLTQVGILKHLYLSSAPG